MNTLIIYMFLACIATEYLCELESGEENNNNKNE
jgi:hypothetical protein